MSHDLCLSRDITDDAGDEAGAALRAEQLIRGAAGLLGTKGASVLNRYR